MSKDFEQRIGDSCRQPVGVGRVSVIRIKPAVLGLAAWIVSGLALIADDALACVVCIPVPQNTAADHLFSADVVVLAREDPEKPFSYIAVEVLKGDLDRPQIDRFLNSSTRRRLSMNPDRSEVLAFSRATSRDALNGPGSPSVDSDVEPGGWRSLGYATERLEALVRALLMREERWRESGNRDERVTYFMDYLVDPERRIRELAYLEVGRAPYELIRKADDFVPADRLHAFLDDPKYLDWHPLFILLLGIDAAPDEQEMIRSAVASRAQFGLTRNLAAWATALIEIDRHAAIDWLEAIYFRAPGRDPEGVTEVLKAFSVQGGRANSALRERIAESYGVLVKNQPDLAGWVARDLTAWNDWRMAEELAQLREESAFDSASAYAIDFYLARARAERWR